MATENGGDGTVQARGNRPRKRTTRSRTRGNSRVGTGIGSSVAGNSNIAGSVVPIEQFGAQMRGFVEGYAAAHGLAPQQLLNGSKKYLTW